VSATFNLTSGPEAFNGDLVANASWTNQTSGEKQSASIAEKVRNVSPVRINEFRISSGPPSNSTDSFIELYNTGDSDVDVSNWTLTEHPTQQAIAAAINIPDGTKLAGHGFYLLGLSNSGLAVPAHTGDTTVNVRSTDGMSAGDTISVGSGSDAETRKIATVGTAASPNTTLWQPLPDGLVITIPSGSTNVPVTSVSGFKVGEKIALGYGATYPSVARSTEKYEVATVTAVGKPGTQAYLGADAPAGSTNIKVTSVANISVGDKIRLDIDSVGHGIETVTVTHVGTQATRTNLSALAEIGATSIKVRRAEGFAVGDKINVGTPASLETVTVTAVDGSGRGGASLEFTPALAKSHIGDETVMNLGTGLDLAEPLKFDHASNLPFSDRGTGITFEPATAHDHSSNEPIQALGTGITLDSALSNDHPIDAVVRDAAVTTAGYQGTPAPNQWFGGPELSTSAPAFGGVTWLSLKAGSMVLRDAAGLVVDSLNYGGLVDPWAGEGYQGTSGPGKFGCYVAAPGDVAGARPFALANASDTSAGRFPDGADTGSNCNDFVTSPATTLSFASVAGATNIKVASVEGFNPGETVRIDSGANLETAEIATVGTAGATTMSADAAQGATEIPVAMPRGFDAGQTIAIGSGSDSETAVVVRMNRFPEPSIVVSAPLARSHAAGTEVSGTGITLTAPLTHQHAGDAAVTGSIATPGAPNHYDKAAR
jgi:non-reducing end alpha-L-arabinofuranosidase